MFRANTSPLLASFVTQLFDGRIDYTDLFPYPTSDRSLAEPGATAIQKLLSSKDESTNNSRNLAKALLASQMPPLAPEVEGEPVKSKEKPSDFGINATNTSQDAVCWLAQSCFLNNSSNNSNNNTTTTTTVLPHQITSELSTHLGVGSYILRSLAPEFSSEVQGVAGGVAASVVLVDEQASGSYVAANQASASYDDDKMMYILEGEKFINSSSVFSEVGAIAERKILLVLARAETQVTNSKGDQEMVKRLAWFPVDLSVAEQKQTLKITTSSCGTGTTIRFNKTPVQGGNVLGAIGDGFRHNGVATLSTHHILSSCICGVAQRVLNQLSIMENNSNNISGGKLSLLQSKIYALESATYTFATNLDRQMSDTIIESACLSSAAYRLSNEVRSMLLNDVIPSLENNSNNSNNSKKDLDSCAKALHDLMSSLGHPDQMSLLAGCCGIEDYGMKLNKRPTLEMTTLRTQRALGQIDHFPSLVVCQEPAKTLEKQIVAFSKVVHQAFVNNGPAVLYREALLADLGQVASLMYTSSCVLARANRCAASKQKTSEVEKKLASLYMEQSVAELEALLDKVQKEAIAPSRLAERLTGFYVNRSLASEGKATMKK